MAYSLALGPFHPVWRGPQRLVLKLDGERVSDIEYRDGYNERGCAERLLRLDLPQALHLVTRICGTCSCAHALAFCLAIERLCGIKAPARGAYLRCIAAEFERIIAHLQASAALLDALGMEARASEALRLRELAIEMLQILSGARLIADICLPGGTRRDLADDDREGLQVALPKLNRSLYRFIDSLIDHGPLLARTVEIGVLTREAAEQFGVRGPLARASGLARDLREHNPYEVYEQLPFRVITQEGGDVYARLVVLFLEAFESVKLIEQALHDLPEGPWQGTLPNELAAGQGSGAVEGPRGMIRYSVESDGYRLTSVRIDTPRQLDRLLARTLLSGALLDNVVAIVASCDLCTSCAEC